MTGKSGIPILNMIDIHVCYEQTPAIRGVSFDLYEGEIHALVGSHRAGKSTLAKLLSGAVRKTRGEILFKGTVVDYFTPKSAIESGIGMVYQHLNVNPSLNTVENIFAGRILTTWFKAIDYKTMNDRTRELLAKLNVNFDIAAPLSRLTVLEQHMVEIARVLSFDPKILILDELYGKFTPEELEKIYPVILDYRKKGKGIIYITHNIDEVFEFADRVTILNAGYRMGTESIRNIDKIKLINLTYSFVINREELKRESKTLFYFKKYNESIIKNIPEGVIILDIRGNVYLVNYAAVRILELPDSGVINKPFREILKGKTLSDKDSILESVSTGERSVLDEVFFEDDKVLKLSVIPFKDDDFAALGTIILIEDISKERYIKDYLLRIEKISSIAELAASVAHEINNPLGIVNNYVRLLKMEKHDKDIGLKITKIEKELTRIGKITESLLSFSKLTATHSSRIDVLEMLDEVVILLEHKMKQKSVSIRRRYGSHTIFVSGDESKLKQVFLNLLMNSIEAVLDNGVIEIHVRSGPNRAYGEISIVDNGCGIAEENLENIFNPFFSTKVSKTNAGLGLSICQHIIELHSGIITCVSKPGSETRFSVRLPMIE